MKRFIIDSSILLAFLLMISACDDPLKNELFVDDDPNSEVLKYSNTTYLEERIDEFSLFLDLLHHADLYNALNDASQTNTLFAPNNEAMREFLELKQIDSVEELDFEYARAVVKNHVLRNTELDEDQFVTAVYNDGQINTMTDFGSYLAASYGYIDSDVDDIDLPNAELEDELNIYLDVKGANNKAPVLEFARPTSNGVVYVMGGVIRPLVETVLQKLKDYHEYTIFVDAIEATGLDSLLSVSADTVYLQGGGYTVNLVNYTCFAVTDAIYQQSQISNLQGLANFIGAGSDYENPKNALYQYIKYHLISRRVLKEDLISEEGDLSLFDTMLNGEVFMTETQNGASLINKNISLVRSNITCKNGIIHKIDQVMPVYQPESTTIIWDFCDHKDIVSIANARGAALNLGNLFTSPLTNLEQRVNLLDTSLGNLSEDDFQHLVQSKTGSWAEKVGFMKCKFVNAQNPNFNTFNALNNNFFIVNVGQMGWVQLKTPTIIKGKYRVELYHGATIALASYYTTGSQTRFIFDDKTPQAVAKTQYIWRGAPANVPNPNGSGTVTSYVHKEVLFDEIEFETSESHTFKAVLMDTKASSGAYRQMWDYLKFIPLD